MRAVLVASGAGPGVRPGRLLELLATALDGTGPAIMPVHAGLPAARLDALLATFDPNEIEDAGGVTTVRSFERGLSGDAAVVLGTSGSTGGPKGVRLSARALLHSARASLARIGARPGERWLCCLPVTHVAGLQVLVRSLVSGVDPVLADRMDPQTLAASGCAHVSLVPTQLRRLDSDMSTLNAFKSVLLGGAAAPAGLVERARAAGVPVVTTYGMTETCGGCVYDGLPLDGVRVAIGGQRDPAAALPGQGDDPPLRYPGGQPPEPPAPAGFRVSAETAGGTGRIWVAGPVLFDGYWRGPSVPSDRWFRTGDVGTLDQTGRLIVRGRADDVINTGGHKVVPGEVAAVLQACPRVKDAVVIGQKDPEWGERVVAVVVPADPDDPPTLDMLRMRVSERLPRYAAPSRVVLVDAVPVLPSGKHDLARLRRELPRLLHGSSLPKNHGAGTN